MMSMSKVLTDKHVPEKRASRAGLRLFLLLTVLALAGCYPATYREVSRPMPGDNGRSPGAPITQIYFYPKAGQTNEQQSRDHYECYNWAMQQTGFDPSQSSIPSEQRVRVVPMPPPGHDTAVLAINRCGAGRIDCRTETRRSWCIDRRRERGDCRRCIGCVQATASPAIGGSLFQSRSGN